MGGGPQPGGGRFRKQRIHSGGDDFLGARGIAMSNGEGPLGEAALDEFRKLRLIRGAETIDEFRNGAAVVSHGESSVFHRLSCAAGTEAFYGDIERFLVEMADLDLAALAEDECFDAIAGDVIAADLDLSGKI